MHLKISRILYEFDIPQVVELRDEYNQVYLGVFTASKEAGDEYCVVRTSRAKLKALYSEAIDLFNIFASPDDGYSLRLSIDSDDGMWFEPSPVHEFHQHQNVVRRGFYLNLPNAVLDEEFHESLDIVTKTFGVLRADIRGLASGSMSHSRKKEAPHSSSKEIGNDKWMHRPARSAYLTAEIT